MKTQLKAKQVNVYDGSEVVACSRISRNLDYWHKETNCNPEPGKHKTISALKDNRFAIILSDDFLKKHVGFVVDDEEALIEIIRAKKHRYLYKKKFHKLRDMYLKNEKHYDKLAYENRKTKKEPRKEELVIVTKDNFLVEIYSTMALEVTQINDSEVRPDYNKIWSVEKDGIQAY